MGSTPPKSILVKVSSFYFVSSFLLLFLCVFPSFSSPFFSISVGPTTTTSLSAAAAGLGTWQMDQNGQNLNNTEFAAGHANISTSTRPTTRRQALLMNSTPSDTCLLLPAPLGPPDHPPPPRRPPPALRPLRRLFLPHPPPTRLLPAPLGPPAHQPPAILPPTLRPLRRLFHPRPPLSRLLPAPLRTPAHPPPAILPPTLRPLRPLRPLHRHFLLHPPPSRLPPPAPLENPAHQLRLLLQAHRLLHRPRYSASALSLTADFLRESLARASPNVAGLSTSTSATRTSPPSRSRRSKRPPASTPCHRSTAAAAPATPCHAASLQRSLRPLPFSLGGSTLSTPANPHCHSRQQSALQPPLLPSRTDLTFWRSI